MAVVLFRNTQAAIRAEQVLQSVGVQGKLIPTPRQLSAECGMALRFPRSDSERVRTLLAQAGLTFQAIHEL